MKTEWKILAGTITTMILLVVAMAISINYCFSQVQHVGLKQIVNSIWEGDKK